MEFFDFSRIGNKEDARPSLEDRLQAVSDEYNEFVKRVVNTHVRVLNKKIRQRIRVDEYGKETGADEIGKEIMYFITRVLKTEEGYTDIRNRLTALEVEFVLAGHNPEEYDVDAIAFDVEKASEQNLVGLIYVLAASETQPAGTEASVDISSLSGTEFEIHCEDRLTG